MRAQHQLQIVRPATAATLGTIPSFASATDCSHNVSLADGRGEATMNVVAVFDGYIVEEWEVEEIILASRPEHFPAD